MKSLRNVDLNLLVALDALLNESSVSAAARRLGLTQPALSHALRRLRRLFDDELLVRGPHGMQPTDRARSLHAAITPLLAEVHSILNGTATFDPATSNRSFRIGMTDAMSVAALPLITRCLRREARHVDLVVLAGGPRESLQRILDGELDLAIGVFPHVPQEFATRELYRDTLVCIADRRNPRLRNGRMSLDDYLASPHVTVAPQRDTGVQLDEILRAMGISRRVAVAVPHYLAVPATVRGTDLVAHTARGLLDVLHLSGDLAIFPIPLAIEVPELEFIAIWHRRDDGDQGHAWLRDLVSRALRRGGKADRKGRVRKAPGHS